MPTSRPGGALTVFPEGFIGNAVDQTMLIRAGVPGYRHHHQARPRVVGAVGLSGVLKAVHPRRLPGWSLPGRDPAVAVPVPPVSVRRSRRRPACLRPRTAPAAAASPQDRLQGLLAGASRLRPAGGPRLLGAVMTGTYGGVRYDKGQEDGKRTIPDPVDGTLKWLDDRLGLAKGGRTMLDKIFPDHWSFLLGEIALYSFVVLLATGVFLSLYYVPSAADVIYHGALCPVAGREDVGRLRLERRPLLRGAQWARHTPDAPLGRRRLHRVHRRAHVPRLLHRRLPPAPGAQLDRRRDVAGPGHRQRFPRLLAARRPGVGNRYQARLLVPAFDPARRQLSRLLRLRRQLSGQRRHPSPLLHPPRAHRSVDHPGTAGRPSRTAREAEAHPIPRPRPDREQRGGLAHVPHVHLEDHRVPVHDHRGAVGTGRPGPGQPDLAVRAL